MKEGVISDEIYYYISFEDFQKLLSVPSLTDDDLNFIECEGFFTAIKGA